MSKPIKKKVVRKRPKPPDPSEAQDILEGSVNDADPTWQFDASPQKARAALKTKPWGIVIIDAYYGFVWPEDKSYEWAPTKKEAEAYVKSLTAEFDAEYGDEVDDPYEGRIAFITKGGSKTADLHLIGFGLKQGKELRAGITQDNWTRLAFGTADPFDLLKFAGIKRAPLTDEELKEAERLIKEGDDATVSKPTKKATAEPKVTRKVTKPKATKKPTGRSRSVKSAASKKTTASTQKPKTVRKIVSKAKRAKAKANA